MQFTALRSLHIESYLMKHTNLTIKCCPIALSLDRVGEGWSIMILRDAFLGLTRFDQFQRSLGIAPNILSRRLRSLVEAGLLEKSRYSEHPPRDAYLLTDRGRDFRRRRGHLAQRHHSCASPDPASVNTLTDS